MGIPNGKYSHFEPVMKGSIHSDQKCPICGSRFKSDEPRGIYCPNHKDQIPAKIVVRYDKITKRFSDYQAALQFLTGLRYREGSGNFDPRDYQVKIKPLSYSSLVSEWLAIKEPILKRHTYTSMAAAMLHTQKAWADTNIKSIQYAQIQDFFKSHKASQKTKANLMAFLKQFFKWANDRYDIPELKRWPDIGPVEMAFRQTIDLHTQDLILAEIKKSEPFKVWLAIKWLATYIAIRPGEMISLTERQVDRTRGLLLIPHPKEKRPKIVPLIPEDREILSSIPLNYDQSVKFFRHEAGISGATIGESFGPRQLYRAWKQACAVLKILDVDLYGGTKHSTAMGVRRYATFEEVRTMTGHSTNKAFERYFKLEGESLQKLYARRGKAVKADKNSDNGLITKMASVAGGQVVEFIMK